MTRPVGILPTKLAAAGKQIISENSKSAGSGKVVVGALMLTAALFCFALQDVVVKGLSDQYAVVQILTMRIAVVFAFFLGACRIRYGWKILNTEHVRILLARGVLAFLAFTSYYLALSKIPMAEASAVYMTAPLFVTLLSVPLLGESVGRHRWFAVCTGFLAVLLIINPGSALFRFETLLPLFSALCYAMLPILTRKVGLSAHVLAMTLYNSLSYLLCCVLLSAAIYWFPATSTSIGLWKLLAEPWTTPGLLDSALIILSSIIFCLAILCITQAYRIASVSAVAPFEYTYLLWSIVMGYFAFGDVPGVRTLLGAAIIVLCGIYVLYRERRRAR